MNRIAATAAVAAGVITATVVGVESLAVQPPTTPAPVPASVRETPAFKSRPAPPKPKPTRHQAPAAPKSTPAPKPKATPKPRPVTPKPTPPAVTTISSYAVCDANPQPCIDKGLLTKYAGRILAGHNYMGWQWLSRVPVGRTVRVTSGPLAGTYRVYGHLRINRQGGSIPNFGGAALVLQSCEGSGTGFSLAHRI